MANHCTCEYDNVTGQFLDYHDCVLHLDNSARHNHQPCDGPDYLGCPACIDHDRRNHPAAYDDYDDYDDGADDNDAGRRPGQDSGADVT